MLSVATAVVSTRRLLVRRPWIQWAVIFAIATAIAASVDARLRGVDEERRSWGAETTVLVTTGPVEVGDPLQTERRQVPEALVPEGAVDHTDGRLARQRIGAGEIVTDIDVMTDHGPQAMTPDGWLAVPVVESPPSGAAEGDRVQVASGGFVVSADAIVVGGFGDVTMLAVPAHEAPLLPAAADAGSLTLLLKP